MAATKRKRPAEVLTEAEVRSLLAACSRRAPTGIGPRLLTVLYRTGLRIEEALNLKPADIDPGPRYHPRPARQGRSRPHRGLDDGAIARGAALARRARQARRQRPPDSCSAPCRAAICRPTMCARWSSAAPPRGYTGLSGGFRCHCLGSNGSVTIRTNDSTLVRRATAWLYSDHLAPGMAPWGRSRHSNSLSKLVGRTGFEPVTFSVSGRRAPAAPTAQDDESLPDSGSGGGHGELRWRAVQIRSGQLVLALDQAERGVARQAQQPANALPARGLLVRAAGMVVSMKMGRPSSNRVWHIAQAPFHWSGSHTGGEPVIHAMEAQTIIRRHPV